ncbi:MAG: hypothetical protein ABR525_08855 [Candidatus Limnocylindria bacterium]
MAANRDPRRSDRERRRTVAGIELAASGVRVVVAQRDEGRVRVVGAAQSPLSAGTIAGGQVADRRATSVAVAGALAAAETAARAERVIVAIDGDDVRTRHGATVFERTDQRAAIAEGEVERALREAKEEMAVAARTAVEGDPSLRGVALVQLRDDVAGLLLDGRRLPSLIGYRGRTVEVRTDVALAPLVQSAAAASTAEGTKRPATVTSGAYALGRLLAESGIVEAGVLRLGADVTAYAIVRDGRVAATRVFALGRDALLARPASSRGRDARVWASCVTSPDPALDGPPPSRWYFVGVPETLRELPGALATAVTAIRGGPVEIAALNPALATRVMGAVPLHADDLVAAGAAALAAGVFA